MSSGLVLVLLGVLPCSFADLGFFGEVHGPDFHGFGSHPDLHGNHEIGFNHKIPIHHEPAPYHHVPEHHVYDPYQQKSALAPSFNHHVSPSYHHEPVPYHHEPAPYHHEPAPYQHEPAPYHHEPTPYHHEPAPYQHANINHREPHHVEVSYDHAYGYSYGHRNVKVAP